MEGKCVFKWLGQVDYGTASKLQRELAHKRGRREIPDTVLMMEHPHTFAIGLGGHPEQLLQAPEELNRRNIACYRVECGGGVHYLGPGVLAVYPILDLRALRLNYHTYLERLESVMIGALRTFKIHAFRQPGQRGVWVLPSYASYYTPKWLETDDHIARIGSVAIAINQMFVSSHGFTINVSPRLEYFDLIIPRGTQGCKVTSMSQVLNKPLQISAVLPSVIQSFCRLFQMEPDEQTAVTPVRHPVLTTTPA
ncbi:MAG: lipoyl(octanoyl) transferase [Chloroflexi bacterium]|nr:MAG: lipoyl(octanoyl) transferase [Chloroflexota bacterium]